MFSATDIANFLACRHLTSLDREEAEGKIRKPFFHDPGIELLRRLGLQHEQAYLHSLAKQRAAEIGEIPTEIARTETAAETLEALRRGVAVIYQAVFQGESWRGRPDFLVRVGTPSLLGPWSYEVVETKLARSTKAGAIVQLCFYSDFLANIQGIAPEFMHVVLGGGRGPEKFPVRHYIAYFRKVRRDYDQALTVVPNSYPDPVEHCDVCSWFPVCDKRWRDDDNLCLVAGITRHQRKQLVSRDVATLARLAALSLPPVPKIEGIGDAALLRIHEQARLQFQGRTESRLIYELLLPVEPGKGLAALPPPSVADVFLDLEGDLYAFDQGLEYLFGIVTLPDQSSAEPLYESLWSFDRAAEKRAFEKFIMDVMQRLSRHPDMHIFHYAPYEPTAIKRLAGEHGTCVDEVDQLLRAGVFVDLHRVVRQGLRASIESYSIKRLEPLYNFTRAVPLRQATLAIQSFEDVLAFGEGQEAAGEIVNTVEGYNRDDCLSTLRLRNWLEDRRRELETNIGIALPRPAHSSGQAGEDLATQLEQVRALMARLLDCLPADETEWTCEQRARWLLAQMLEWHRREDKSAWWEYFRLCELSDDELIEDKSALGGLVYIGEVGRVKRSIIYRYQFPIQDHSIDRALDVRDPRTQKGVGEVVDIDERNLTIDIKRSASSPVPHPTALIPFDIMDSRVLSCSLLRLGSWVADNQMVGPGRFEAARSLLLRRPPQTISGAQRLIDEQERLTQPARDLLQSLARNPSVLPIQGPPGSGKTYSGARMVVKLVKQGRRIGITAVSHKVISNLLGEICRASNAAGVPVRIVQKPNDCDGCPNPMVKQVNDNEAVLDTLCTGKAQVAAGTAWLWARPEMASSVDVLFVDEAGQMSLANVLAIAQAATSVVLLGDPQQLDQPQQGVHPPGADVSTLAHLLNGHATIGPEQGIFLAETWRLHRDICAFTSEAFYDGRLRARPENQKQRVNAKGSLDGTGLRFIPIKHTGNQNESPEEVDRMAGMVDELLRNGATWTSKKGKTLPLGLANILFVAPYNAQVSALARRLPAGARVGTVDKFQGQEAPVVFYSMATSTPEDAPRGMEFLYSLNRLNVAISRAQCVAVLVANPALFEVQCKNPRQMQLVNAFCRYLEMATGIG
jgi:predicted RecB family nuclease